jgi:hypothetical protein
MVIGHFFSTRFFNLSQHIEMVQPNARSRPEVTIILESHPNLSLSITDILELFNFTIREFKVTNPLKSNHVKETERQNTVTNARMVRSTQKTARL